MSFADIRLTPKFFNNSDSDELSDFLRDKILRYFKPIRYLIAKEKLDSKGRETHLHYHLNMELEEEKKKDSIQKWFRDNNICKGNKAYSIRTMNDPNDEDRWWRYCCKECLWKHRGFSKDVLEKYGMLSKDERALQIQKNLETEKSIENKNQKRDKLFKWLKDNHPTITETRALFILMVEWYRVVSKDTPPLANKCLLNKVLDYRMEIGVLTAGEYFDSQGYE